MLDMQRIDQVIDALLTQDVDRAVLLVREVTGSSQKQALDFVWTLMEGLDEAAARGIQLG